MIIVRIGLRIRPRFVRGIEADEKRSSFAIRVLTMKAITNVYELAELQQMVDEGYISVRQHPTAPLYIYNYTAKAQYEGVWNHATLTCRGIITDSAGTILGRPFAKFFNLEQLEQLPNEPFEVYEKLDGSLGILYWLGDEPYIATRGSFESPQAQVATQLLRTYDLSALDRRLTYLFEIIYPENRIVVNYGARRELERFSLGCIQECFPARSERSRESGGVAEEAGSPSTSLCGVYPKLGEGPRLSEVGSWTHANENRSSALSDD
jgi:hypothetical protein